MRKICLSLLFLTTAVTSIAQGFNPAQAPPWVLADNYGRWALQGRLPNTYTFPVSGSSPCQITQLNYGDSSTFLANSNTVALAPVLIADNDAQNAEVLTPASVFPQTSSVCGWGLNATHPHISFSIQSGTGGLQEAINAVGGSTAPYPTVIYLSPQWYKLVAGISSLNSTLASQVTPSNILADATCTSKVFVVDLTTLPATDYQCSGSSLVVVPSSAATSLAGGAKGSAPYQSANSTTAFLASPITSGHTFVYAWAPTGSAIDPEVLDLATWFAAQTYGGSLTATQVTTAALGYTPLSGLTATINGTLLSASCDSGTASVTSASAGDPVAVSATTGANTVTVYICGTGTPASLAYNVVVNHASAY